MKRLIVVTSIWILLLSGASVTAQDSEELQCGEDTVFGALESAIAQLQDAQELDASAAFEAIIATRSNLAALDSECLGLDFEGTGPIVTDPVYVPQGIYRVTLTSPGADELIIVAGVVLDGICEEFFEVSDEFILVDADRGAAVDGVQSTFRSDGCLVVWESSFVKGPFAVTFEKLR